MFKDLDYRPVRFKYTRCDKSMILVIYDWSDNNLDKIAESYICSDCEKKEVD
jgi:hypothetical protein